MKIVVDVPDEEYECYALAITFGMGSKAIKRILNGTPLPKGHGRLIDADSMKTMKNIQSANFNAIELIRFWIDNQPTIIEADKEGAEE